MSQYFPKTFKNFGENVNAKVDLSNYATKVDIKNISRVDTANFALKSNLASLKLKLINDIDKLVPTAVDLSKISDVAGNDVIKKNASDKLVTEVNNVDTSWFVLNTKYDTDKSELERKVLDISKLVKKTDYNAKFSEIESKIPSISGLTKAALTAVENKILDVRSLVKKIDYNTKINDIEKKLTDHNHDKYNTTPELNKLTAKYFAARLKQANVVTKTLKVKQLTQTKQNIYLLKIN